MKYRSKPVEVEAVQFMGEESCQEIRDTFGDDVLDHTHARSSPKEILISISDGYSRVNPTNWIYKDESGKIYVIKDSRFKRKYDAL